MSLRMVGVAHILFQGFYNRKFIFCLYSLVTFFVSRVEYISIYAHANVMTTFFVRHQWFLFATPFLIIVVLSV
jgi:hypothetical protein